MDGWDSSWVDAEAEPCRLIYFSSVRGSLSRADLKDILGRSRRNNAAVGVTGALCFDQNRILQVLEGKRLHVNRVFGRILADPRHHEVGIVTFAPAAERLFPVWSMLYVGADRLTQDVCRRFCGVASFRPERLTADRATALVAHFAGLAAPAADGEAA
jgi:hypothetical protein